MDRKIKYQIFAGIVSAVIIGFFSFGYFMAYGGMNCNLSYHSDFNDFNNSIKLGSCDCFCCNGLYGRGYESCGMFGLFTGLLLGVVIGPIIIHLFWKIKFNKK